MVWILIWLGFNPADPAEAFESCRTNFAEQAQVYQGADCYYRVGKSLNRYAEASAALAAELQANPQLPWAHFYLGRIAQDTGQPDASAHYLAALDLFGQREDGAEGQVYALINLSRIYADQGVFERELQSLQQAEAIAAAAGMRRLRVTVALDKTAVLEREGQYELAESSLAALKQGVFASGSLASQIDWLLKMTGLTVVLGQPERAHQLAAQLEKLAAQQADPRSILVAGYSAFMIDEHFASWSQPTTVKARAERLLQLALTHQIPEISMQMRYFLAKLAGGEQGLAHLDAALLTARQLQQREREAQLLIAQASLVAAQDPALAQQRIREAFAIWGELEAPSAVLDSIDDLNQLFQKMGKPRSGFAWSVALLDYIEAVREWQTSDMGRAGFLSRWSSAYYLPAGRLLAAPGSIPFADLAASFAVMERLRARTMRESLQQRLAASERPSRAASPIRLGQLFQHLDPALAEPELAAFQAALSGFGQSTTEVFQGSPQAGKWPVASLAQVQASMTEAEALLSFQLGEAQDIYGQTLGGAWLLLITRHQVQRFAIAADRDHIAVAVSMYRDLLRDPKQATWRVKAGSQLYQLLLQQALSSLPESINHLILIPDVALYRLPFETLTSGQNAVALGSRYQLSQVPSATLWLQWRQQRVAPRPPAALVLANSGADRKPLPKAFDATLFAALPVLGKALSEGQRISQRIGPQATLYTESEAKESLILQADVAAIPLLHFAAHAVVDESRPKMSAIVLAGDQHHDGYLFASEIAKLNLKDQVIVLSTCQSASGYLFYGEGPLSLARAFMQAGARTVIGTLWPIEDAAAEAFFEPFYNELMRGKSVAQAVQTARQVRIAAGAAVADWAGIVVLGDGSSVPFEAQPPKSSNRLRDIALLLFAFYLIYQSVIHRRKGKRHHDPN